MQQSRYLVKAIKNNYANNMSLFEETEQKKKAETKKNQALAEKKQKLHEKLTKEFKKEQKEKFLASLDDEAKENLIKEILEEVKGDKFAVAHIKKKGLDSPSAYLGIIKRIDDFERKKDAYIKEKMKEAGF